MSHMPSQSGSSLDATERRQHSRHQVKSLAYLDIGPDNGGIVVNISEGGIALHAVGGLPPEAQIRLRIQLPKSTKRLEADGKIAWISGSRKNAGVEFIDLPEDARSEIKEWLSVESAPEPIRAEEAVVVQQEAPQPERANRSEKWTSLLAELTSQPTPAHMVAPAPNVPVYNATIPLLAETQFEEPASSSAAASSSDSGGFAHEKQDGEFTATPAATNELIEQPPDIFPNPEMESKAHREPIETSDIRDTFTRRPSSELSLPSDSLLNTPSQPFTVVSGGGERSRMANRARIRHGAAPGSPAADDFLTKARALFSVKRAVRSEPEFVEQAATLESALSASASAASVETTPQAESLRTVQPEPRSAPAPNQITIGDPPKTTESIPNRRPAEPRLADVRAVRSSQSAARGLDLPGSMLILVLCLILAAACLGLGILVGRRSAATPSGGANTAADALREGTAPDAARTAGNSPIPVPLPNSSVSNDSAISQRRLTREAPSHTASTNSRRAAIESEDSSSHSASEEAANAANSQSEDTSRTSAPTGAQAAPDSSQAISHTPASPTSAASSPTFVPQKPGSTLPAQATPPDRLVPAHAIYRVEPFYPRAALQQGVEGVVKIRATVDQDGRVKNLRVVSGPALLTSAALDAAKYWRYIPSLRNGEPIETEEEISIEFHLAH